MSRDELDDLIDDLFDTPYESKDEVEEEMPVSSERQSVSSHDLMLSSSESLDVPDKIQESPKEEEIPPPKEESQKSTPQKQSQNKSSPSLETKRTSSAPATSVESKIENSPSSTTRRKKGPKFLREIKSFKNKRLRSTSKLSRNASKEKIEIPVVDHKEVVLSLQQMAFKLFSLQQSSTAKRKVLHKLLVEADSCPDKDKAAQLERQADDIREELYHNEMLMGSLENNIVYGQNSEVSTDALSSCAAVDRFLEQENLDSRTCKKAGGTEPTLVLTVNDLPDKLVTKAVQAGISAEDLENHFEEFLAVLRHTEGCTYMTEAQIEKWKAVQIGLLMLPNYGRIRKPLEHFLTDEKMKQSPKKLYRFINSEGKGGFGQVFFAKNKKTSKLVAIKKQKVTSKTQRRQIANEVSFLSFCNHQNIVGFEDVFMVGDEVWVVMDYLNGGTVSAALQQKKFTESHMSFIADQVLLGLKYLHSNNIVHSDLKGDNIMLTECGEVYIVDLGLCIDMEEFNPAAMPGGTCSFMSPELINHGDVSYATDIWSLGITLLEMANGSVPFNDELLKGMFQVATRKQLTVDSLLSDPSKWSNAFKSFIDLCLNPNHKTRATAEQLLMHRWFEIITEDSQDDIVNLVRYCWARHSAPVF